MRLRLPGIYYVQKYIIVGGELALFQNLIIDVETYLIRDQRMHLSIIILIFKTRNIYKP
jgi:hypothetical protein